MIVDMHRKNPALDEMQLLEKKSNPGWGDFIKAMDALYMKA